VQVTLLSLLKRDTQLLYSHRLLLQFLSVTFAYVARSLLFKVIRGGRRTKKRERSIMLRLAINRNACETNKLRNEKMENLTDQTKRLMMEISFGNDYPNFKP